MRVGAFNRALNGAVRRSERELEALERAYLAAWRDVGRAASRALRQHAVAITAAGEGPKFRPPDPDELLPRERMADAVQRRTRAPRERAARTILDGVLSRAGIAWDVGGVFSASLAAMAGARLNDFQDAARLVLQEVIEQALNEGWTVPQTATAIGKAVDGTAGSTATMLARTDLVGTQNGASIMAARQVYPDGQLMKRWLATGDERTRPSHEDADGQLVPLDQPFQVGGVSMDYPGDPAGPDEEVCNCRCTVVYEAVPAPAEQTASARWRAEATELERRFPERYALVAAAVDFSDGTMVCVYPAPEEARRIARENGLPAADLHVTLAFIPEAPDDEQAARIGEALRRVAGKHETLTGVLGGIGRFADGGDGPPILGLPSVVGLDKLRVQAAAALDAIGVEYATNHGWVPHMTLGYGDDTADPEGVLGEAVTFDAISFVRQTARNDYPLGREEAP